jgi:hypothetical protein
MAAPEVATVDQCPRGCPGWKQGATYCATPRCPLGAILTLEEFLRVEAEGGRD